MRQEELQNNNDDIVQGDENGSKKIMNEGEVNDIMAKISDHPIASVTEEKQKACRPPPYIPPHRRIAPSVTRNVMNQYFKYNTENMMPTHKYPYEIPQIFQMSCINVHTNVKSIKMPSGNSMQKQTSTHVGSPNRGQGHYKEDQGDYEEEIDKNVNKKGKNTNAPDIDKHGADDICKEVINLKDYRDQPQKINKYKGDANKDSEGNKDVQEYNDDNKGTVNDFDNHEEVKDIILEEKKHTYILRPKSLILQVMANCFPCHMPMFKILLIRSHQCRERCSEMCLSYKHSCENRWLHRHYNLMCEILCTPCFEKYEWKCEQLFQELLNHGCIIRGKNSFFNTNNTYSLHKGNSIKRSRPPEVTTNQENAS